MIKANNRFLLVLRGIPGSGKSTYADNLMRRFEQFYALGSVSYALSTDHYWYRPDGRYDFNFHLLNKAHEWNFKRFEDLIKYNFESIKLVILDNTNIKREHFQNYVDLAKKHGFIVKEKIVGEVKNDEHLIEKYYNRNKHNVPFTTIRKMAMSFEK